jgi:hypothetical protein
VINNGGIRGGRNGGIRGGRKGENTEKKGRLKVYQDVENTYYSSLNLNETIAVILVQALCLLRIFFLFFLAFFIESYIHTRRQ